MATRTFLSGWALFGVALALVGSGCADDSGLGVGLGGSTETETDTTTRSKTDTSTMTVTQTKTAAPTDTGTATSTMTVTRTVTTTPTDASTNTATGSSTATVSGSGTGSSTATKTGTTTTTSTQTVTMVVTTATITTTVTQVLTYNGYTLENRALPPAWTCPASTGTGGAGGSTGTGAQLPTASTLAATDCKSLANLRRPILKAQSQSQLDQVRSSLISRNCVSQTETICVDKDGKQVSTYYCYGSVGMADAGIAYSAGGSMSVPGVAGGAGGSGATDYSTTNTQVASVDEADYVKNDGNTIFVLGSDGLHVIDAWPAAETHEVARVTLSGTPRRLFLLDNRLVVYSKVTTGGTSGSAGASNPSDQGCTYGYNCRFSSEGGHTLIQVFDVTTPASPTELVRYEMSGGYVDSRRIGSFVYTMVHDTGATQVAGLGYNLQASSYDELQANYAQLLAANFAKIDASNDDFFLPWTSTTKSGGTAVLSNSCAYALATQYSQGGSFVSINTFDLTALDQPTRTILASNAGYIYASATSLYMAVDRTYEQNYSTSASSTYSTYQATDSFVHKFKLNGVDTAYVGSVTLPGHILNQFAMDEDDGILRVASTKGWDPDPTVTSFVTTFGEQSGALGQLGQVGDIATGEDIRSVRFDGDRGFVVTFKKTDPLFVFDLSNPSAPKKLGELQIPGFSTYMQRLDANHLLAIGFTADDQGSYAYFNGIQIQIFDVTDLANPTLAWKKVIGTRGSNSEALTNHLAFNYFAAKKMLSIPITICEGGGNGVYATNLTFAGLMAFDISLDTGITEHGRLPFLDTSTVSASSDCNKWWTDSKSLVKRSIFMDDYIYGLSDAQLRVAALSSMSSVLQSVPLTGK